LKDYSRAYAEFDALLERLPAVYLFLPITTLAELAHTHSVRNAINGWSFGILVALLVLGVCLFVFAKPWRWVGWQHLVAGLALQIIWAGVFYGAFASLGEMRPGLEFVNQEGRYEQPCYVRCDPLSPGAETAHALYAYGAVGCWGIFLFTVASTVIRPRLLRGPAQGIFALLLCAGLLTVYYMRHFESVSNFTYLQGSVLHLAQSSLNFEVNEPEPWVLTDPLSYPGLDVDGVGDAVFKAWLERHIPKTKDPSTFRKQP
jgi:hypothetical protein